MSTSPVPVRRPLNLGPFGTIEYHPLAEALDDLAGVPLDRVPRCVRVLVASLLHHWGRLGISTAVLKALVSAGDHEGLEIPFLPSRVLLQDFTGVPCIVDLAALRSAVQRRGGDPRCVEPLIPVDLVIDHSVQLDFTSRPDALARNMELEFARNRERYVFLRWGRRAFSKLRVIPPGLGICHQVNMEYLAAVVHRVPVGANRWLAIPDTLVGTDSHTTMVNSLGVLGWGVGGIEAEAAMLGHPIPLAVPRVVGVRLSGALPPGTTATDAALTLTQRLRKENVVDCLVEFFGPGVASLAVEDRAPLSNMAPEYGATCGWFPIDEATLRYLRLTGRPDEQVALVEAYAKAQGLWHDAHDPVPAYDRIVEFDLSAVEPSVAGPRRPHDRMRLHEVGAMFDRALVDADRSRGYGLDATAIVDDPHGVPRHPGPGAVVIASITSCTNTSNPSLLIAAGLVAKKAVDAGLSVQPWVKASLAPGSRAATALLQRAHLLEPLERLGFHVAAYGCATCIGNSGPLDPELERQIRSHGWVVAAVLSGNRNFEGRIHPLARANYLCSPPLVVAYALRGTVRGDLTSDPIGIGADGRPRYLRDVWPSAEEIAQVLRSAVRPEDFRAAYEHVERYSPQWAELPELASEVYEWDPNSTYIREPPFVQHLPDEPPGLQDIERAAVLGWFGDFVTTDHISPAGTIPPDSPAGRYLRERGVPSDQLNTYGARRGNHEVMMRGTFGNVRLRNRLVDCEGNWTLVIPTGQRMSFYDAAMEYRRLGIPLVIVAGAMYGAGSSRDWAAKGTALLGVRAVIAQSFERIHRSNLVEMGVLPLTFPPGESADTHGWTGRERITIRGLNELLPGATVTAQVEREDGAVVSIRLRAAIANRQELEFLRQGGILPHVFRHLLSM